MNYIKEKLNNIYIPLDSGKLGLFFSILAIRDQVIPPTINLENPDCDTKIDLVPLKARERVVSKALSNSFGFGGTNASLIVGKVT